MSITIANETDIYEYESFIAEKLRTAVHSGFDPGELLKALFPFQAFIVRRALIAGKYAIFADCGLGKTLMQLVWARAVADHTDGPVLILAPLAVVWQTVTEAERFSISLDGILITNYEQLDNIDASVFAGIVLDESSILKSFDGATKKKLIDAFAITPYKLACTATPSPNDPEELGNHAEFLNVLTRAEMLAMYFVHDAGDTGEWRIKGHGIKHFWEFVASWAVMLRKPSDIGFDDAGYELPALNLIEHKIHTPNKGAGSLFNDTAVNATDFNAELRRTKTERLTKASEIVHGSEESFLVIVKQNEEGQDLRGLIPGAVEVSGSDSPESKVERLRAFANDETRVLISKNKIIQFGLNFQNSHNIVVASLDFSFEGLYQVIRREWRFGQTHEVNVHIITTDTMTNVIEAIREKQRKFEEMQKAMSEAMNANLNKNTVAKAVYDTDEVKNDFYHIQRGDSFRLIKDIPDKSIDFSFFSPPFASLFTFSDAIEDLSNCRSYDDFFKQFSFMVPELLRITKPGRLLAMHLTQLTTGIGKDGFLSLIDFRGDVIRLFQKFGWIFHGEVTIWKSPELAAVRTKNVQLLHATTKRDCTVVRPGLADYLVIVRAPGINSEPVNFGGEGLPFEEWTEIASPVWMSVRESDTLQYRTARVEADERHLTPTQLKVIRWALMLYSNPGDTVYTPFMGIGSEVWQSVKMGRKGIGHELKESYYSQAKSNLAAIIEDKKQAELFE